MFCWDIFGIKAASQVFPYSAKNLLRFMPYTKAHQLKVELIETLKMVCRKVGHVAALVRSHMNGLKPFERTIEKATETMSPSSKTITAATVTTNRITSLRELLHYREKLLRKYKGLMYHDFLCLTSGLAVRDKWQQCVT